MNIFTKVTLRNLMKNKTRTIVTIIGILLSTAMFTAVTTSVSSLRHFLVDYTVYTDGNWHGSLYDQTTDKLTALNDTNKISQSTTLEHLGFAKLDDSINEAKPYLCVYGIESDANELLPIHVTQGRMPENSSEILLPDHLAENGGISHAIGDTLSLDLGTRTYSDGSILNNHISYDTSAPDNETLTNMTEHNYIVVGFYERPSFEDYSAPGYTALTIGDDSANATYEVYFQMKNIQDASSFVDEYMLTERGAVNNSLLRLSAASGQSTYNGVFYTMGTILVAIIMFGSISLIYNAFSISISERTKQFGILGSIGATKRQLKGSVLTEGLFLSIIGIPLGILSGLLGMGITFYFIGDQFASFFRASESGNVTLRLHPSLTAILIAVGISLATILISAYLPAKRAMKKSAIECIRQSDEIKIRPNKLKTSKLTSKLFGFEGTIASKNYKRNGKKYRATVFSLFISVVLFISASSFGAYLVKSAGDVYDSYDYNLSYDFSIDQSDTTLDANAIAREIASLKGVTDSCFYVPAYFNYSVPTDSLDPAYIEYQKKEANPAFLNDTLPAFVFLDSYTVFVADDTFRDYLEENNIPTDGYFNPTQPKAVIVDHLSIFNTDDQRYHVMSAFRHAPGDSLLAHAALIRDKYDDASYILDENGEYQLNYYDWDDNLDDLTVPLSKGDISTSFSCDAILDNAPSMALGSDQSVQFYFPYSQMNAVLDAVRQGKDVYNIQDRSEDSIVRATVTVKTDSHKETDEVIKKWISDQHLTLNYSIDYDESTEESRAMILVINVFSYGFIILISLIAAANVFNTISTNINLRRREFAMLKSVGMTPYGFKKMMNFECLLYGFKGLLYGLPVSFVITWLIYRAMSNGMEMAFFIPWYSIVIAVASVFIVVFSTMLYSMSQIKKENTIDALKNENI